MIRKTILNLFGALLFLVGSSIFLLEEAMFGIGFVLLGLILITPISKFLYKKEKRLQPVLFAGISAIIVICTASFGRKAYYEKEPIYSKDTHQLSVHAIYQIQLNNGLNYSYIEKGNGPVVVLLHGFPDMASTWDETITDLSKDHRVIAPFLRGYYPTDMSPENDYSVKTVAEDIVALLNQLEVDNFTVVGQDWGASIAFAMGNLVEERIRKIVSIAIPHSSCLTLTPKLAFEGRHFFILSTGNYGVRYTRKNDFEYIERLYQRWSPDYINYKQSSVPIIETFKYPNRLEAALGYYRSFANETNENKTFYNKVPNIPVCFMVGEHDAIATPEIVENMKNTMPEGSITMKFQNAGHFLHREVFTSFIDKLRGFIEIENKIKAVSLLQSFNTGDTTALSYVTPNGYIQHNLGMKDGVKGISEVVKYAANANFRTDVIRVFQDGDYVFTHSIFEFFDAPQVSFDVFRFKDGLMVEHWDNLATIASHKSSGHKLVDGETAVKDQDKTETNKALVLEFANVILVNRELSKLDDFIDKGAYIQHNSEIEDGSAGLISSIEESSNLGISFNYFKIHKVLGEGNFVLLMSEGEFAEEPTAFYDLFRVENSKIVEHWDVLETIPVEADWKNINGKF